MKNFIISLITVFFCFEAIGGENTGNIYIYRNDGYFNAFLANEIDSMRYSNLDLDSVHHELSVVQEIWTQDSIYRIPLSVIDSVSVNRSETMYKPEVLHLYPDYVEYIDSSDGMTINFLPSLPNRLFPKKGDIVVYDRFDTFFENGFAGRIKDISVSAGDGVKITCDSVSITELYENIVYVDRIELVQENGLYKKQRIAGELYSKFHCPISIGGDMRLEGDLEFGLNAKVVLRILNGEVYFEFSPTIPIQLSGKLIAEKGKHSSDNMEVALIDIPIPSNIVGLYNHVALSPFINWDINGAVEMGISTGCTIKSRFIYANKKLTAGCTVEKDPVSLFGDFTLDGSIWFGPKFTIGTRSFGNLITADLNYKSGVSIGASVKVDMADIAKRNFYSSIKNSEIKLSWRTRGDGYLNINKIRNFRVNILPESEISIFKSFIFPEFLEVKASTTKNTVSADLVASRSIPFPCRVGIILRNESDSSEIKYYHPEDYPIFSLDRIRVTNMFDNLSPGATYTVSPLINWAGLQIEGSPSKKVNIECDVITGHALSKTNSVKLNGHIELKIDTKPDECGFCISESNRSPDIENSRVEKLDLMYSGFNADVSGLNGGVTYYYRAYAKFDDRLYYGDVQCITTKSILDRYDGDNTGGDYSPSNPMEVQSGRYFDVAEKSAIIELIYKGVSPESECGYMIEAEVKNGKNISKTISFGPRTGTQTIGLSDLLSGTTYRYTAFIKSPSGNYIGTPQYFTTIPIPEPEGITNDIAEIEMTSATLNFIFKNIDENDECGIELINDEWKTQYPLSADDIENQVIQIANLLPETNYSVRTYISRGDEVFYEKKENKFTTKEPEITGLWEFHDGQGRNGGRIHDVEFLSNGTTKRFYGVNQLEWKRHGRLITLVWRTSDSNSNSFWEYNGVFNDDFSIATGTTNWVLRNESMELDETLTSGSPFYLIRK